MKMIQNPSLRVKLSAVGLTLGLISFGGEASLASKGETAKTEVAATDGSTTPAVCERLIGKPGRFSVIRTLCETPVVDSEVAATDGSATPAVCERLIGKPGRFSVIRTLCETPVVDYKGEIGCTLSEYTEGRAIVKATPIDAGLDVGVVGYWNENGERVDANVAGPGETVVGVDVRTFIPRTGLVGIVTSRECAEPVVVTEAL